MPLAALTTLAVGMVLITAPANAARWAPPAGDDEPRLVWHAGSFASALGEADEGRTLVAAYFWMDGSEYCARLYQETLQAPETVAALSELVCYSVSATEPAGANLVRRLGVSTLPTVLFLGPGGEPEDAILGFVPPADFVAVVERIRLGQGTVSAARAAAAEAPDDLALRLALANKLAHVGATGESEELVASIRRDDPDGRTVVGARLALYDVMQRVLDAATDPADPTTIDLAPLYDHVRSIRPATVLFEAWEWIGDIEARRGDRAALRRARMAAWPHLPDAQLGDWGAEVVDRFWDMREELDQEEKAFALEVALAASNRALELLATPADSTPGEEPRDFSGYVADRFDGLARCYHLNGKREEALAAVRRALELDPGVASHQTLLDWLLANGR